MVKVLEQAQLGGQQGNGELLDEYLQQIQDRKTPVASEVLDVALEVLEVGDFQERWEVAKLFPSLGIAAIEPLIAILEDAEASEELRWFAGRILGKLNHPEITIAALIDLISSSESEELNTMAASALADLGTPAIEALTDLLASEKTRLIAVRSLGCIGNWQTIDPLLTVVDDPDVAVCSAAIEALSCFHDPRIHPVLIKALNHRGAAVRLGAVTGLGLRPDLLETVDLISLLRDRLWDINIKVCTSAAIALGRLGTKEAAAALFELLNSPQTPVPLQRETVCALGWICTTVGPAQILALEYLHGALHLVSTEVVPEIVTILGRIEQHDLKAIASEILIEMLHDPHGTTEAIAVKQAAALSLGQLGELRAASALIPLLADPATSVKLHAIAALKQLGPSVREQLEQLASKQQLTEELKLGVAYALQEWPLTGSRAGETPALHIGTTVSKPTKT